MTNIKWNNDVKLILSDVDETIADLYVSADPRMHQELIKLLEEGVSIFFVTGQGLKSVQWRVIEHIPTHLRKNILIGHCSGAEVVGFNEDGSLREVPFYSVYNEALSEEQKIRWREIVQQLIKEFKLDVHPTGQVQEFISKTDANPLSVMLEDRGPQITFEFVNGYDLTPEQAKSLEISIPQTHGSYDIRIPVLERADELFIAEGFPVTPRLGGVFALDLVIKGISKTTAVKFALENEDILNSIGLSTSDLEDPKSMEIWGDKFSVINGGSDRYMSEAVSQEVRSIDFREENPEEFMKGYNIVVWDGEKHLHEGTLEYLELRSKE